MNKQCLDIKQMQHLQELGLKLKETLLYWARCVDNNPCAATHYEEWALIKGNNTPPTVGFTSWQFIPAYTLQDILDLLPYKTVASYLHIGRKSFSGDILFYVEYSNFGGYAVSHFRSESLIEAAYEMLCWCIENKFVETNKNE